MMFNNKRIGVFVDLVSLFNNVNNFFPKEKVDYDAYLTRVENFGPIYKSIAYGASVNDEADNFIKCLTDKGFDVKYVSAKMIDNRPVVRHTNRTIDMIVDIIKMMDHIDVVVIGSSYPELASFTAFLRDRGITVIIFSCNIPKELKYNCDEWWEITERFLENKRYIENSERTSKNAEAKTT